MGGVDSEHSEWTERVQAGSGEPNCPRQAQYFTVTRQASGVELVISGCILKKLQYNLRLTFSEAHISVSHADL